MIELTELDIWQRLEAHRDAIRRGHLREWFQTDPRRFERLSRRARRTAGRLLQASDHRRHAAPATRARARARGVEALRDRMFAGEHINITENRPVLHVALRNRSSRPILVDGRDVMPDVRAALEHMRDFSDAVRSGAWTGFSGLRITDVVNIGIGGSDLGPAMVTEALTPYTREGPRLHFVSNVDGSHLAETLRGLHPATTLFIVASKTFTTEETMMNARSAREWFLAARDGRGAHREALRRGVDQRDARSPQFGIAPGNMFVFWDWVGGRYSLWSSIGLPIAIAIGFERFEQLLDGAHAMDEHFRPTPIEDNLPITLGLLGVWYTDFLGAERTRCCPTTSICGACRRICSSSTWRATASASIATAASCDVPTGPIVWGEPGTNGQHAFYQLIHQGTRLVPCDFLIAATVAPSARRASRAADGQLPGAERGAGVGKTETSARELSAGPHAERSRAAAQGVSRQSAVDDVRVSQARSANARACCSRSTSTRCS